MKWQKVIKKLKNKIPFWNSLQIKQLNQIADLPSGKSLIPDSIASTDKKEELQDKNLVVRFDYYNESICVFDPINSSKAVSVFRKLQKFTSLTLNKLPNSGLIRCKMNRKKKQYKSYNSLFASIPEEIENIYETEFSGEGRIFWFKIKNNIQIISIETKHRNINL